MFSTETGAPSAARATACPVCCRIASESSVCSTWDNTLECKSENTLNETSVVSQASFQHIDTRADTGRLTCLLMGLLRALRRLLLHELLPLILLWMMMVLLLFLQLVAAVCGNRDLQGKTKRLGVWPIENRRMSRVRQSITRWADVSARKY